MGFYDGVSQRLNIGLKLVVTDLQAVLCRAGVAQVAHAKRGGVSAHKGFGLPFYQMLWCPACEKRPANGGRAPGQKIKEP